ncbi:acyl-CoA thioesterase [Clostridia bacterium]|nr:acyl-CoA thioesterase [Clostridia bacterium]
MKTVLESRVEHVEIVFQQHINSYGRLFGGVLMSWIDVVAAVVARRHSHMEVSTVTVDSLRFKKPIFLSDTVVLIGQITWTGHRAMEVRVDTYTETLKGERTHVNRAYLVLVAIDENGQVVEVEPIQPQGPEELEEYASGTKRQEYRLQRKEEGF